MKYYPESAHSFKEIIQDLRGKDVIVIGHRRPDGDSLGSQVALTRVLVDQHINAQMLLREDTPYNLKPFIQNTPTCRLEEITSSRNFITINVDCAEPLLVGEEILQKFPNTYACIDHHLSNKKYADYNIVESNAAATAQILTGLFLDLSFEIDPTTAQALYVGIVTDTAQFKTSSTQLNTFILCAELIRLGAKPDQAALYLYEQEPFQKLQLLHYFLESLKLELSGSVCVGCVTQAMLKKTNTTAEHTEGFANYPRSVEDVKVGVVLEEKTDGVKASLRCKDASLRLDLFASLFNGGGHACAAGLKVHGTTLEAFYPVFLNKLKEHLNSI